MREREDRQWRNKEVPFTKATFPSHLNKLLPQAQPKHISKIIPVLKEKHLFYSGKLDNHILSWHIHTTFKQLKPNTQRNTFKHNKAQTSCCRKNLKKICFHANASCTIEVKRRLR